MKAWNGSAMLRWRLMKLRTSSKRISTLPLAAKSRPSFGSWRSASLAAGAKEIYTFLARKLASNIDPWRLASFLWVPSITNEHGDVGGGTVEARVSQQRLDAGILAGLRSGFRQVV